MTKRLLIIDDDTDILEVAQLSLTTFGGYEVEKASSGGAGIEAAKRAIPDAILLDVRMPSLDGPATLRRLRENKELTTVPVIFLTASTQHEEHANLTGLGATGVISKPFDPATLAGDVARLLGWV